MHTTSLLMSANIKYIMQIIIRCGFFTLLGLHYALTAKRRVLDKMNSDFEIVCNRHRGYTQGNRTVECRKCSLCPGGYGVKLKCTHKRDTMCAKCKDGYFSPKGYKHCRKCKNCPDDFRIVRSCSTTHNSKCKPCRVGKYYSKDKNKCLKCRDCRPGSYVSKVCTKNSNTLCKRCPYGTFTDRHGQNMLCKPCRPCQYNEDILKPCTRINDNKCGNCSTGYFRLKPTGRCTRCSECYRHHPGYTIEISECVRRNVSRNNVCMPVVNPPPVTYQDNVYLQIKDIDDEVAEVERTGFPLYKTLIIGITSILLMLILTILVIYLVHRRKMVKIKETRSSTTFKRNSEVYTENWLMKFPDVTISHRSNSVPYVISDTKFDVDFRGRSNTFSNEKQTDCFENTSYEMSPRPQDKHDHSSVSDIDTNSGSSSQIIARPTDSLQGEAILFSNMLSII